MVSKVDSHQLHHYSLLTGSSAPLNMTSLERSVGVEDLVLLEPLVEESLLKNLQLRYENKEIYVSAPGCSYLWVYGIERTPDSPQPVHAPFIFFPDFRLTSEACSFP